jgi:hypothetical protein
MAEKLHPNALPPIEWDDFDETTPTEAYTALEQHFAEQVMHPEACDYTLKASAVEIRDHLCALARHPFLGCDERQKCGPGYYS